VKIADLCCGAGGFSLGFVEKDNTFIGVDTWIVDLMRSDFFESY
jgi:site-specific DNA-cytosine methylase